GPYFSVAVGLLPPPAPTFPPAALQILIPVRRHRWRNHHSSLRPGRGPSCLRDSLTPRSVIPSPRGIRCPSNRPMSTRTIVRQTYYTRLLVERAPFPRGGCSYGERRNRPGLFHRARYLRRRGLSSRDARVPHRRGAGP